MKEINMTRVAIYIGFLMIQVVASYSYSSTIIGDVRIQTLNNGSLYCDSMICQPGNTCQVTKRNDPNNFQVIVRNRKCLDGNGNVLNEETVNEDNPYQARVNLNVVSGGGGGSQVISSGVGRQMTSEEQREFEENLRRTQQQVQDDIAQSMNELQSNLRPLLDGSFASNLRRQIQDQVRNSLFN